MGRPDPRTLMRNPFSEPLTYLMGGESHPIEVADFPRHGKRMVRTGQRAEFYDIASAQPFWDHEGEEGPR